MTCWGKLNAMWHFISMLFCWRLSAVETLIEQLHESWDVQSCLFTLKLVVGYRGRNDRVHSRSALHKSGARHGSDMGTGADRGHSSQCLCWVYTSTFLNHPRSGSPRRLYSDLSCHIKDCQNAIYYLNFLKKNKKHCICSVHMRTKSKDPYRNGAWCEMVPRCFRAQRSPASTSLSLLSVWKRSRTGSLATSTEVARAARSVIPCQSSASGHRASRSRSRETDSPWRLFGNVEASAKCVSMCPAHCRKRLPHSVRFSPPRFNWVIPTLVGPEQALVMEQEVNSLLRKEAIEVVPPLDRESGFYSRYFIFPKKDWGLCLILDLCQLNRSVMRLKFRMLKLKQVVSQIRSEDWFVTIDLKDTSSSTVTPGHPHTQLYRRLVDISSIGADVGSASRCHSRSYERAGVKTKRQEECAFSTTENHLSGCGVGFNQYRVIPFGLAFSPCTFTKCVDVSILPQHRKFLRFAFGGEAYQYRVIPFGLAFSPCTFTKCVDAALAPPWLQGIRILNCIDDWLILVQSEQTLVRHRDVILAHMKELGLRLNAKKSVLSPLQRTT